MTIRAEALMNESFTAGDQLLVTPEEAARRLSVGRCRRVPVSSLSLFVSKLIGDAVVEQRRC